MAECPTCKTPGAYIGFTAIECRNPDCEHFVIFEEKICPCCGKAGHTPDMNGDRAADGGDDDASLLDQVDGADGNDADAGTA